MLESTLCNEEGMMDVTSEHSCFYLFFSLLSFLLALFVVYPVSCISFLDVRRFLFLSFRRIPLTISFPISSYALLSRISWYCFLVSTPPTTFVLLVLLIVVIIICVPSYLITATRQCTIVTVSPASFPVSQFISIHSYHAFFLKSKNGGQICGGSCIFPIGASQLHVRRSNGCF